MKTLRSPSAALNSALSRLPGTSWATLGAWGVLVGSYSLLSLTLPNGRVLTAYGDIAQCVAALFACVCLVLNAFSPDRRKRAFWLLLALGCGAWFLGQVIWTYFEVVHRQNVPNPFIGDVIMFLHPVPMLWALALKPHDRRDDLNVQVGIADFSLILVWWVYLYLYAVIPWQYISPDLVRYGWSYDHLAAAENILLVVGFAVLLARAKEAWREVYAHLFSASLLYAAASYLTNRAIDQRNYYTGSPFDLPLVASFVWFGTAGLVAYRLKPVSEKVQAPEASHWLTWLARGAAFSIPVMALWNLLYGANPSAVRIFRIGLAQVTLLAVGLLVYIRQRLVDHDRLRLLEAARESYDDLKHFQAQMIQTEKLVSLGQLAAGAAHEINNPLTGILGYSDLLVEDPALGERQRAVAGKIRTLARRIKTLVTSLLSFARRVPAEKTYLDINQAVTSALSLSNLDLRGKKIEIETLPDPDLPPVRGDANQILQVFFNLMSNAVDALEEVGGGKLVIRTGHDDSKVVVEFSDTGPGIKSPHQVFDPFFTTKPVGKGTGLGLSICYGIVQEHGGRIQCFNRPEGGATFVVQFPAVMDGVHPQGSPVGISFESF